MLTCAPVSTEPWVEQEIRMRRVRTAEFVDKLLQMSNIFPKQVYSEGGGVVIPAIVPGLGVATFMTQPTQQAGPT